MRPTRRLRRARSRIVWTGPGTFGGTTATTSWHLPATVSPVPSPVTITLTAVETYVEGKADAQKRVGPKDVRHAGARLAEGNPRHGPGFPHACSRNRTCRRTMCCTTFRRRATVVKDVPTKSSTSTRIARLYTQDFSAFRISRRGPATINFHSLCVLPDGRVQSNIDACSSFAVHWEVIKKSSGVREITNGVDYVSAVVENNNWRLCHSELHTEFGFPDARIEIKASSALKDRQSGRADPTPCPARIIITFLLLGWIRFPINRRLTGSDLGSTLLIAQRRMAKVVHGRQPSCGLILSATGPTSPTALRRALDLEFDFSVSRQHHRRNQHHPLTEPTSRADATVTVGGVAATNVVLQGSSVLTAVVGAKTGAGAADVVVTSGGHSATLSKAFTFVAPSGANQPPVVTNIRSVGSRSGQPSGFADQDETVTLIATVSDADTSTSSLVFAWSGPGTFSATEPITIWHSAGDRVARAFARDRDADRDGKLCRRFRHPSKRHHRSIRDAGARLTKRDSRHGRRLPDALLPIQRADERRAPQLFDGVRWTRR